MSNPIYTHWTPKARATFLAALRNGKTVSQAAAITGLSRETAYRLRRRNPRFALAWSLALEIAQIRRLVDLEADRRFQAYFRIPANMRFCNPAGSGEPRVMESNIISSRPAETRIFLYPLA